MDELVEIPVAVDDSVFRRCLRQMSSHVCVVTSRHEGVQNAITATAVTSVTADPPQLLVCIHHEARAAALIQSAGAFAVNMLSETQSEVAKLCSISRLDPEARFSTGRWQSGSSSGMPVLEGACASFECWLESVRRQGTHYVIFGIVLAAHANPSLPLLYRDGNFMSIAGAATA